MRSRKTRHVCKDDACAKGTARGNYDVACPPVPYYCAPCHATTRHCMNHAMEHTQCHTVPYHAMKCSSTVQYDEDKCDALPCDTEPHCYMPCKMLQ